jgi:FeS assembly SUF system regulator
MLRMTKQTDYGFVLLSHLAHAPERVVNAPDLAHETRLPLPMVSKILKLLARHDLLRSHRGVKGGYSLARPPAQTSAAQILRALEGPVALTVCVEGTPGECDRESFCQVRRHWQKVNEAVDRALEGVTLDDLAHPDTTGLLPLVQLGRQAGGGASAAGRAALPGST